MTNTAIARADAADIMERVITTGDLAQLRPAERVEYYRRTCESVGLNPLTRPFEYIVLDGKMTLYARKDATDQLRQIHKVSILELTERERGGVYIVTAKAQTADGRQDVASGAVSIAKEGGEWAESRNGKRYFKGDGTFIPLQGDALANALMKAETKAKRRVTLSICGLGWLDETEIQTIADARQVYVDVQTGEINPPPPRIEVVPHQHEPIEPEPSIAERTVQAIEAIEALWRQEKQSGGDLTQQTAERDLGPLNQYTFDGLKRLYRTVKARVDALAVQQQELAAA